MAIPFNQSRAGIATSPQAGVQTRHPDAAAAEIQYRRIRDVLDGTDAVRANARQYISQTVEHQQYPETYEAMIARTSFVNYTARTVDGLEGMIFRKNSSVTVPPRYKPRLENVNNAGDSANTFSKKVCREVLCYGRALLLVDVVPEDQQRDSVPASRLPYLTLYTASNIINWRTRIIDGQPTPDQVILREFHSIPQEFGSTVRTRYRVLELDEQDRYRVRIYDQTTDGGDFYLSYEDYPGRRREEGSDWKGYMNRIPVVFISPVDLSPAIQRSPILDLVDANLSHFLLESEHATALFYTAQPTLVITGLPEDASTKLRIGSGNSIMLPEGCTAQILEFHGHGLGPLENALDRKVDQIAELGARLMANVATGPETAEAARIRQHSQTSVVSSIARTVSDGIQAGLEIACRWVQAEGKITFELNQDYLDVQMSHQMMAELRMAYRDGLLPLRQWFYNLVRGEVVSPDTTYEQFADEIENDKPILLGRPIPIQATQPPARQPASGSGQVVNRSKTGKIEVTPKVTE